MTLPPRRDDVPRVSIILPTYNRADTLPRAIDSVLTQHLRDWELLVVDDGSQDGSCAQVQALAQGDARIRLLRQANAGVAAARNTGLAAARGHCIAFLDSDDAWQPHFLSLTTAYLRSHPEAAWVSTAFEQDCGNGLPISLPQDSLRAYAAFARSIGSQRLSLPAGETDDLLRAYPQRAPLGPWADEALAQAGLAGTTHQVYQADLFEAMRWGYLGWLPATVLTRTALASAGTFDPTLRSASDFPFLARLARHHRAHLISVPSVTKHERAPSGRPLQQDHLATGRNAYRFEVNKTAQFRQVFADGFAHDRELRHILCHYELYAGLAALRAGLRDDALHHLRAGARWQPHLRAGYAWLALALVVPSGALAAKAVEAVLHGADIAERLATGHTSLIDLGRKATGWFSGEA